MNKKLIIIAGIFFLIVISMIATRQVKDIPSVQESQNNNPGQSIMAKVFSRVAIEKEAKRLAKEGRYDEAIEKYKLALLQPMDYEHQKGMAMGGLEKVYLLLEDYDKALEIAEWFLAGNKNPKMALERIADIKALKTYKETNDPKAVLERIEYYKKEYPQTFPPYTFYDASIVSRVLQMYDKTKQYGSGAELARKFAGETYRRKKEHNLTLVLKAIDAKRLSEDSGGIKTIIGRYYQHIWEWYSIAEAFEKDKENGTSGSPTKIIIQSENIPW